MTRPRVEGEAWAPRMPSSVVQDEINYCTHKLDRTFRDEVDLRTYFYICQDWRDFQVHFTRLTAEVARLREALTGACDVLDSAVPLTEGIRRDGKLVGELWDGVTYTVALYPLRQQFRAALALPTPAPEK